MPCIGPDLKEIRKHGQEAGKKLLVRLIDEHKLRDISADKDSRILRLPGSDGRWKQAKKEFVRAVEELFVEDACNGF